MVLVFPALDASRTQGRRSRYGQPAKEAHAAAVSLPRSHVAGVQGTCAQQEDGAAKAYLVARGPGKRGAGPNGLRGGAWPAGRFLPRARPEAQPRQRSEQREASPPPPSSFPPVMPVSGCAVPALPRPAASAPGLHRRLDRCSARDQTAAAVISPFPTQPSASATSLENRIREGFYVGARLQNIGAITAQSFTE